MEMDEKRTANQEEMAANQQAYNTDGTLDGYHEKGAKVIEIYSTQQENRQSEGVENPYTKLKDTNEISKNGKQSKTLIRTDVDSHQNFRTPNLQNQEGGSNEIGYKGSSLNITAYNVYEGDGSQATKPSSVVVGVAGSSGHDAKPWGGDKNAPDWKQNYNTSLSRSTYNRDDLSDDALRAMKRIKTTVCDYSSGYPTNCKDVEIDNPDWANVQYEIDMREKVRELKKYQDKNVPIILVGDSKGGEDAAYLALKSEQSGIPIDHLYLTNPKGIRLSGTEHDEHSDYGRLCKMAREGKITVEIVYPEVLSDGTPFYGLKIKTDGSGLGDGREIPGKRIYTVPNNLDTTRNHTISDYESDVYQGVGGNFKFQCDKQPLYILDYDKGRNYYRYEVSRITNRSGATVSIGTYFFQEKAQQLEKLKKAYGEILVNLEMLGKEQLFNKFKASIQSKMTALKTMHEGKIAYTTDSNDYAWDADNLKRQIPAYPEYKDNELNDALSALRGEYESKLHQHVDMKSSDYDSVVSTTVSNSIIHYELEVSRTQEIVRRKIEELDSEIAVVHANEKTYEKSQMELIIIIENSKK